MAGELVPGPPAGASPRIEYHAVFNAAWPGRFPGAGSQPMNRKQHWERVYSEKPAGTEQGFSKNDPSDRWSLLHEGRGQDQDLVGVGRGADE